MIIHIIREVVGVIVRFSGLFYVYKKVVLKNKIVILIYHDPDYKIFLKHVKFLSKYFSFINMDDLEQMLSDKRPSVSLPENACIITFDDGHKGNFNLLPVFREFSIRPLIYLCSRIICTNRHYWWKENIVSASKLKTMPNSRFISQLKMECGYEPEKEFSDRHALNASELKALSPYVLFGSHSRFHPILVNCTDSECFNEISESKNDLENLLGIEISHFAYPNGDFSNREIEHVRKSNYKTARNIKYGVVNYESSRYTLNGIEIDDRASISILCAELIGLNSILKTFFKRIWNYSDD